MKMAHKIMVCFFSLFIIMMLCVVIIIRVLYGSFTSSQLQQQTKYSEKLIINQISQYFQQVKLGTEELIFSFNDKLVDEINIKENFDGTDIRVNQKVIAVLFDNILIRQKNFKSNLVCVYGTNYSIEKKNFITRIEENIDWISYQKKNLINPKGLWKGIQNRESGDIDYFYFRTLKDIESLDNIGYVAVEMDVDGLRNIYEDREKSTYTSSYIFDEKQRMVIGSSEKYQSGNSIWKELWGAVERNECSGKIKQNDDKVIYNVSEIPGTDWKLISLIDMRVVEKDINSISQLIIVFGGIALIIGFFVINKLSNYLSKPVTELSDYMLLVKEEFPGLIKEKGEYREIETLKKSFNIMIKNNQKLFYRLIEEESLKHILEMSIVHEQIKPHFLYNTLDTTYCLIDMEKYADAKKSVKLLADYYRLVLNKGFVWVSVEQEIKSIIKYLQIQQLRYPNRISFDIDVDTRTNEIYIPNLILQPLVENAIYHGIKPSKVDGKIKIITVFEKSWIYLHIVNNGNVFSTSKFEEIMRSKITKETEGFGLKNVADRIKLCFGSMSGIRLSHNGNNETIISICIYLGSKGE